MSEEIKAGDLVEARKGERKIIDRVTEEYNALWLGAGALGKSLNWYRGLGYTLTVLEKAAAPPLPTEPGYYLSDHGPAWLWQLGLNNDWHYVGNEYRPVAQISAQEPDRRYGLTRLEPVPETVQKVIDHLVDTAMVEPDGPTARDLRARFGVTQ